MASWVDLADKDFTITCGDGQSYTVNWLNATRLVEYNVAVFEYPNVAGSYVDRREPKGRRYAIEIFIQGDNNVDTAFQFEQSSANKAPWTISHPLYGRIIVQPLSLEFDNSEMNVTKISAMVIETISQQAPITSINNIDNIQLLKSNLDTTLAGSFNQPMTASNITSISNVSKLNYNKTLPIITVPADAQRYTQLLAQSQSSIASAIASPQLAITSTQALINAPASFDVSTKQRVQSLSNSFSNLRGSLNFLNPQSNSVATKQLYQIQGASNLSATFIASVTPNTGDYNNSNDVVNVMDTLQGNYNQYISDLNSLQTNNGAETNSYIADAASIIALNNLYNLTLSVLFNIALNSKQERTLILEKDYNIIILTHRLYGLDPFDSNIQQLFVQNNLGINDVFILKKGRTINYYI